MGQPELDKRVAAALFFGMVALVAWMLPVIGVPVSAVGVVLGIRSVRSGARIGAFAAIAMSAVGLLLAVANALAKITV